MKAALHSVASVPAATLSIGDLARRTGVTAATLRVWETRYGFPVPHRRDSGHRRYGERDVERILDVVRRREAGTRLDVAIEQSAMSGGGQAGPGRPQQSIFAELRRTYPVLMPQRLRKRTLLSLSWAIEDEFASRAEPGHIFGAFQQGHHFEAARQRWEQLSLTAGCAFVFADFDVSAAGLPHEVALEPHSVLRREWALVMDTPGLPVALSAWEMPGQQGKAQEDRYFEAMWTVDPGAVRHAARVAAKVAERAGVPTAHETVAALDAPVEREALDLDGTMALLNRMIAYTDTLPPR